MISASTAEDEIEEFVLKNTEKQKATIKLEQKPAPPKKRKVVRIAAPRLDGVSK